MIQKLIYAQTVLRQYIPLHVTRHKINKRIGEQNWQSDTQENGKNGSVFLQKVQLHSLPQQLSVTIRAAANE